MTASEPSLLLRGVCAKRLVGIQRIENAYGVELPAEHFPRPPNRTRGRNRARPRGYPGPKRAASAWSALVFGKWNLKVGHKLVLNRHQIIISGRGSFVNLDAVGRMRVSNLSRLKISQVGFIIRQSNLVSKLFGFASLPGGWVWLVGVVGNLCFPVTGSSPS